MVITGEIWMYFSFCQFDIVWKSLLEIFHKSYFYIDKNPIFETLKNLFGEMKQFYKSKSLFKLSFLFIVLFSAISVLNSCKKDDDDEEFKDHIVQFEVKGTTGVISKTIVTQVGTTNTTMYNTVLTPITLPWSSGEFFVNSSQAQLNLSANATMPNDDSKLTVTIWIDGEVSETKTVTGKGVLDVAVFHSFLEL
jgi:hypothetical protein